MAKDAVYHRKTKYDNLTDDTPTGKNAFDIEKNRAYLKPGMSLPDNQPPAGTNEKGSYVLAKTGPSGPAGQATTGKPYKRVKGKKA